MTGKPIELMEYLVRIVEPGGVILDPFMGSASTGVAAIRRNYKFVGIEQSEEYFTIAQDRLAKQYDQIKMEHQYANATT